MSELRNWSDYDLEMVGRLTHPLGYDPATDRYVPMGWNDAFNHRPRAETACPAPMRRSSTPPAERLGYQTSIEAERKAQSVA